MPRYPITGIPTREIQLDWIAKLHKANDDDDWIIAKQRGRSGRGKVFHTRRMTDFEINYVFEKLEKWIERGIKLSEDQIYRLETIYARRTD